MTQTCCGEGLLCYSTFWDTGLALQFWPGLRDGVGLAGCPQAEGAVPPVRWMGAVSVRAVSSQQGRGGGNRGGFVVFPLLHLGSGSRASDTRGKTGTRSVSASTSLCPSSLQPAASQYRRLTGGAALGGLLAEAAAKPTPALGDCVALNCFLR